MSKLLMLCALLAGVLGCGGRVAPAPPAPRTAMTVAAPINRTWDAAIDAFAERNVPIRNMERVSGFISTDALSVSRDDAKLWADCGSVSGIGIYADRGTYNVLVRGDSTSSTVKVTVRFTAFGHGQDQPLIECSTKGVWESSMEARIKTQAEARNTGNR